MNGRRVWELLGAMDGAAKVLVAAGGPARWRARRCCTRVRPNTPHQKRNKVCKFKTPRLMEPAGVARSVS